MLLGEVCGGLPLFGQPSRSGMPWSGSGGCGLNRSSPRWSPALPQPEQRGIFNLGVGLHRGSGILWGVLWDKKAEIRHLDSFALPQCAGFMHLGELDYKSCNKWKLFITVPQKPFGYHISFVSDTEVRSGDGQLTLPPPPWGKGIEKIPPHHLP